METENKITPEQLAEWKELCEKATPGPWRDDHGYRVHADWVWDHVEPNGAVAFNPADDAIIASIKHVDGSHFDSAIIAASRTALPLLIAEVERLRKCLDQAIDLADFSVDGIVVKAEINKWAMGNNSSELADYLRQNPPRERL